jgi:hypothetical protein
MRPESMATNLRFEGRGFERLDESSQEMIEFAQEMIDLLEQHDYDVGLVDRRLRIKSVQNLSRLYTPVIAPFAEYIL